MSQQPVNDRPLTWDELPEILTAEDIRAYLRYESLDSAYDLLRSGRIKAIGFQNGKKANRHWRVTKREFEKFVFGANGRG